MTKAISYARMSTREQLKGDSLKRQISKTEDYCKRKGYDLDLGFILPDIGVSAFRSKNAKFGNLATFLDLAQRGKVPKGTVLIVESLDRISRDSIRTAQKLFNEIIDAGITICTLTPEREFTPENANDVMSIIEPLFYFSRANEESVMKSERLTKAWGSRKTKLREGKINLGKVRPYWLDYDKETKTYVPIPERVKLIKEIFRLRSEGFGIPTICKVLNQGETKPLRAQKWNRSTVAQFIENRGLLGEFTPCKMVDGKQVQEGDTVKNYYPVILTEDVFYKGQCKEPQKGRHQSDGATNLFKGIVVNGLDGSPVHAQSAQRWVTQKKDGKDVEVVYKYTCLVSSGYTGGFKGASDAKVPYPKFEAAFLRFVKELDPKDFIKGGNDVAVEIAELSGALAAIEQKIVTVNKQATSSKSIEVLMGLLGELHNKKVEYQEKIETLKATESHQGADTVGEIQTLGDMLDSVSPEDELELRIRIRGRIRRLVETITIYPVVTGKGYRNAKTWVLYVRVLFRDGTARDFMTDDAGAESLNEKLRADLVRLLPNHVCKLVDWMVARMD